MAESKPPSEVNEPWREEIDEQWNNDTVAALMKIILDLNTDLTNLMTNTEQADGLTVCLIGPPGHGKSSTINGFLSALENRHVEKAVVKQHSSSVTREFRRHRPRLPTIDENHKTVIDDTYGEKRFSLAFADFIGLGKDQDMTEAMLTALHGLLSEGQKAEKTNQEATSSLKEKMESEQVVESTTEASHVIWVVDVQSDAEALDHMKNVTEEATRQGIAQALVLTKCDKLDNAVVKDPRQIYISKEVESQVMETASIVGVPIYRTFPIKNYTTEMRAKSSMSYQYLYMLQFIMMDIEARLRDLVRKDPKRLELLKTEADERKNAKKK